MGPEEKRQGDGQMVRKEREIKEGRGQKRELGKGEREPGLWNCLGDIYFLVQIEHINFCTHLPLLVIY